MRDLSHSEKRTVRLGGILLGAALVVLGGQQAWKFFAEQRAAYTALVEKASMLKAELQPYQDKAQTAQELMKSFHMDPAHLYRTSVVAEASAAILKAATSGGVQLGPIKESAARQVGKELASIQLDCTGQVSAVLAFIHKFESLGFPVLVDSVQMTPEPNKPGTLKVHLGVVILDFEQWKGEPRA